jgi:ribonuclease HII
VTVSKTVRLIPDYVFECEAWARGFRRIAGLDEVGCGPLAGPVVAAAVVLPRRCRLMIGLRDSKRLNERERERFYGYIAEVALGMGVGIVESSVIDAVNIRQAARLAMEQAIQQLSPQPDYLILDALTLPKVAIEQRMVIKGDGLCVSIAAASVIAKVTRDRLMADADLRFPQYGFLAHKGYGTREHLRRLRRYGPCSLHRQSFRPIREAVGR